MLEYGNKAYEIAVKILFEFPDNERYKKLKDNAICAIERAADCFDNDGESIMKTDMAEARNRFDKAYEIRKTAVEYGNEQSIDKALSTKYIKYGKSYACEQHHDKTIESFHKALGLRKRLEAELNTYKSKIDVSECYYVIGNYYEENSDFENALKYYDLDVKQTQKRLRESDSKTGAFEALQSLWFGYERMARMCGKLSRT